MTPRPGTLYLVPNTLDFGLDAKGTPDIQQVLPLGTLRIAAGLGHWVVENAKTARAFLKRVDAAVPLAQRLQAIEITELPRPPKGRPASTVADLDRLLAAAAGGHDIGLLSEAGMPAVADPGAAVVQAAHAKGMPVVPLSGPSSLLMGLAASGLNGQSFAFVGYLPVDAGERASRIKELEAWSRRASQSQVVIETPYRNAALLDALVGHLHPATRLSVSCGLTLAQGWTRSDSVERWRAAARALPADVPAVFAFQG